MPKRTDIRAVVETQLEGDRSVVDNLAEQGDNGAERDVEFWFYGERKSLELMIDALAAQGLALMRWLDDGAVLTKWMRPRYDEWEQLTPLIVEIADRYGVTYDGWETEVVTAPVKPQIKSSLLSRLFGSKE